MQYLQRWKGSHFSHFVCKDDSGSAVVVLCLLVYSSQCSATPNTTEHFCSHILLFFCSADLFFVPKFVINIRVSAYIALGSKHVCYQLQIRYR
jgi:hypothetical protein